MNGSASSGRPRASSTVTSTSTAPALRGSAVAASSASASASWRRRLFEQHVRELGSKLRQRPVRLEHVANAGLRLRVVARAEQDARKRGVQREIGRRRAQRLFQIAREEGIAAHEAQAREIRLRIEVARALGHRTGVFLLGFLGTIEQHECARPGEAQLELRHTQRLRALERGERLLGALHLHEQRAEIVVRDPITGGELERTPIDLLGLEEPSLIREHEAEQ